MSIETLDLEEILKNPEFWVEYENQWFGGKEKAYHALLAAQKILALEIIRLKAVLLNANESEIEFFQSTMANLNLPEVRNNITRFAIYSLSLHIANQRAEVLMLMKRIDRVHRSNTKKHE